MSNVVLIRSISSTTLIRSKCGNGPNICVIKNGSEEKLYFGISDATSASAVLDVAVEEPFPIELLVAADVIAKVGTSKYNTVINLSAKCISYMFQSCQRL